MLRKFTQRSVALSLLHRASKPILFRTYSQNDDSKKRKSANNVASMLAKKKSGGNTKPASDNTKTTVTELEAREKLDKLMSAMQSYEAVAKSILPEDQNLQIQKEVDEEFERIIKNSNGDVSVDDFVQQLSKFTNMNPDLTTAASGIENMEDIVRGLTEKLSSTDPKDVLKMFDRQEASDARVPSATVGEGDNFLIDEPTLEIDEDYEMNDEATASSTMIAKTDARGSAKKSKKKVSTKSTAAPKKLAKKIKAQKAEKTASSVNEQPPIETETVQEDTTQHTPEVEEIGIRNTQAGDTKRSASEHPVFLEIEQRLQGKFMQRRAQREMRKQMIAEDPEKKRSIVRSADVDEEIIDEDDYDVAVKTNTAWQNMEMIEKLAEKGVMPFTEEEIKAAQPGLAGGEEAQEDAINRVKEAIATLQQRADYSKQVQSVRADRKKLLKQTFDKRSSAEGYEADNEQKEAQLRHRIRNLDPKTAENMKDDLKRIEYLKQLQRLGISKSETPGKTKSAKSVARKLYNGDEGDLHADLEQQRQLEGTIRQRRVSAELKRAIEAVLQEDNKDLFLEKVGVTIRTVEISKDLRNAIAYYALVPTQFNSSRVIDKMTEIEEEHYRRTADSVSGPDDPDGFSGRVIMAGHQKALRDRTKDILPSFVKNVQKRLDRASGFITAQTMKRVRMKFAPKLQFVYDPMVDSQKIELAFSPFKASIEEDEAYARLAEREFAQKRAKARKRAAAQEARLQRIRDIGRNLDSLIDIDASATVSKKSATAAKKKVKKVDSSSSESDSSSSSSSSSDGKKDRTRKTKSTKLRNQTKPTKSKKRLGVRIAKKQLGVKRKK